MTKITKLYLHKSEIPKSCFECPLNDHTSDFPNIYCNITNEIINDQENILDTRHSTCPLKEIINNETDRETTENR